MNFIKQVIIVTLLLFSSATIWACSCIGSSSVKSAKKNADLVISGTVIKSKIIKIWGDTSMAIRIFNSIKKAYDIDSNLNYEQWKNEHPLFSIKKVDYTVIVKNNYKGASKKDTVTIRTGFGGGDCGYKFSIGENYLIYADEEYKINYTNKKLGRSLKELKNIYRTSICKRTKELTLAKEEVKELIKY